MKIIDKKGRVFGKINIIDLAVIFLLIFAVVAVGVKFYLVEMHEKTKGRDQMIEYTLLVGGVRQPSVDAIRAEYEGILDAETEDELGDFVFVDVAPARGLVQLADGEYTFAEYTDRFDVTITVQAQGYETPQGYYLASGKQLIVGNTLGISNGHAQTFGEILTVTVVEKQ